MKVAISVNQAGKIVSHLGKAKLFAIYEKDRDDIKFIEERVTDGNHQNHIIEDIKDCDVVISGKIGQGMVGSLAEIGIDAMVEDKLDDPVEVLNKI